MGALGKHFQDRVDIALEREKRERAKKLHSNANIAK